MRELLFTKYGLTNALNSTTVNRNFGVQNHLTPVVRNEGELQTFGEKIKRISEQSNPSYSFEISPARTDEQFQLLMKSAADLVSGGVAKFTSVTWHLSPSHPKPLSSDRSGVPALRLACGLSELLEFHGRTRGGVLLNLSAAGLKEDDVTAVLDTISQKESVQALFIVRGDGKATEGDFTHAVDLVKFVRNQPMGKKFCIGVAGYPLGHPESPSYEEDLLHLEQKVEAGADFIISQVVFEASTFLQFVKDCRRVGIMVPILPGVPIVADAEALVWLCQMCQVPVPQALLSELSSVGAQVGLAWCVRTSQQLVAAGVTGIHFFTLNSIDNLKEVLKKLPSETLSRSSRM